MRVHETFLLIHPPLLGPEIWRPCADALRARGADAVVPDLRPVLDPPAGWWRRAADLAAAAVAPFGPAVDVVIVGHAGAGAALPIIAERIRSDRAGEHPGSEHGKLRGLVFVDSALPAVDAPGSLPDRFADLLPSLAVDGTLPRWSQWWGPDAMRELIPDVEERRRVEEEQPRLPLAFYDEMVPVPAGWTHTPGAYLQFSEAYQADEDEAAARGWPVRRLAGQHLEQVRRPHEVAALLMELAASVAPV